MKRFIVIAAAALSLSACVTTSNAVNVGKGISDGWVALHAAADTADAAVKDGYLHGAPAAKVSADLKAVSAALTVATKAYDANPVDPSIPGEILTATTLTAEVLTLSTEPAK